MQAIIAEYDIEYVIFLKPTEYACKMTGMRPEYDQNMSPSTVSCRMWWSMHLNMVRMHVEYARNRIGFL